MEIRALTGFNEETIRQYGRSYTPINGASTNGLGATQPIKVVETNTTVGIPPITLLLLGIGAYAVYKNLK